jgi:hypothetical protein
MPRINSLNTFVFSSIINSAGAVDPEQANYQGATMVFVLQGTAPTGWVKDTSDNDYTLRCVTGSVSSGGSSGFTSVMSSKTLSGSLSMTGTVGGTSLTGPQLPIHDHTPHPATNTIARVSTLLAGPSTARAVFNSFSPGVMTPNPGIPVTNPTGGPAASSAHSHPLNPATSPVTFTTINFSVKYVEAILATRT